MKKFLLALGVVAALSLLFVGCDKPTDEPETPATPETPAETTFDGNVDLTKLAGYDAAAGGIVCTISSGTYQKAGSFKVGDLGWTADCGLTKVYFLADVYNGDTKYDIASDWDAKLMIKVNNEDKEYNQGSVDPEEYGGNHAVAIASADDVIDVYTKTKTVTKVVIKSIIFIK